MSVKSAIKNRLKEMGLEIKRENNLPKNYFFKIHFLFDGEYVSESDLKYVTEPYPIWHLGNLYDICSSLSEKSTFDEPFGLIAKRTSYIKDGKQVGKYVSVPFNGVEVCHLDDNVVFKRIAFKDLFNN
jgi:hypothetical protein